MKALALAFLFLIGPTLVFADPMPQPKRPGQSCPSNYYTSGSYCVPSSQARETVPKTGSCPSGWFTSGQFCVAPEKRR